MDSPPPKKRATMDQGEKSDKFVEELEKQLTSLKENALSQGLQEIDVTKCVKAALSRSLNDAPKVKGSRWKKYAAVSVAVALTVVMLPFLTDQALNSTPGYLVTDFLMKHYMTSFLIFVRRHTFFLHRYNISRIYSQECLISNPAFESPSPGCLTCRRVHTIKTVPDDYRVRRNHLGFPLVFKNRMANVVTLDDIAEIVGEKRDLLDLDITSTFKVSVPWVNSPIDLANPDVINTVYNTSDFSFIWSLHSLVASQLLRKKFPRHKSLPPESEVSLDKKLIIEGWNTPPLSLGGAGAGGTMLYIQGEGMRKLVLTPHHSCSHVCIPVSILVNQTDFVTWPADFYEATLFQAGSNISVAMLGLLL